MAVGPELHKAIEAKGRSLEFMPRKILIGFNQGLHGIKKN